MIESLEYRSNISSAQLNTMLRSLEESSLRAIIRGAEFIEQTQQINTAITAAYLALSKNNQLYNYYPTQTYLGSGEYGGCAYATAYGEVDGQRQNKSLGLLTMDWKDNKKLSKIPITDGVVSPSLQIYVDSALRSQEDPVYNILNDDLSSFWIETASIGEHTVELVLPASTQRTFNYMEVLPFPIFGVNVNKIEYYDAQSTLQTLFSKTDKLFYNESAPLAFHLSPKQYNNRVKFTIESLSGIGVIGLTRVDICSIDYLDNPNTVYLKFENIPNYGYRGRAITQILPTGIELDFYVDGVLNENYDTFFNEISIVNKKISPTTITLKKQKGFQDISTTAITVNEETPNALYLKLVMNEVGLTSPVFRGAKLYYREA
jgi:hypothetical protein